MPILYTETYKKIRRLTKRIRIVQGAMSSSKTYSILQMLFQTAYNYNRIRITILTSTYPLLVDGVIADMQNIYHDAGQDFANNYNKSTKNLSFPHTSSIIQFRNLDSKDINKGKGARREILYINEANRVSLAALDPFIVRTNKYVIMDFNADVLFWAHEKYALSDRIDVDYLKVTYQDNELIPKGEMELIESRIEESKKPDASKAIINWVNIYAYGLIGNVSERLIYSFNIVDDIPKDAKQIYSGLDVAQSPDKTAALNIYQKGINLYLDELFSLNGLLPVKITGAEQMAVVDQFDLIKFPKDQIIICDSANLTTITDLRKYGYQVFAAKKPQFSQRDGLLKTRSFVLNVTRKSLSIINSMNSWYWKLDHNGLIETVPESHEPDILAAFRYAVFLYFRGDKKL